MLVFLPVRLPGGRLPLPRESIGTGVCGPSRLLWALAGVFTCGGGGGGGESGDGGFCGCHLAHNHRLSLGRGHTIG